MTPSNMIPQRVPRQVHYTDGTPSREGEDDEDDEISRQYYEGFGYKKPSTALELRDRINNLMDLIEIVRISLLAKENDCDKASNVLYFKVYSELQEIEKELKRL